MDTTDDKEPFEVLSLFDLFARAVNFFHQRRVARVRPQEHVPVSAEAQKIIACREAFARVAGMDADRFLRMATKGLPPIETSAITIKGNNDSFEVRYRGDRFGDSYSLNFQSGTIGAGDMASKRNDRVTGRRMFALRAMSGVYFGFRTMGINAGDMMGAYIWAKTGAIMRPESKNALSRNLQRRLMYLKPHIDMAQHDRIKDLIALKGTDNLRQIALMNERIAQPDVFWDEVLIAEDRHGHRHRDYVARGYIGEGSISVGQYMLCGLAYDAFVNLQDPAQMAQIETYTGVKIRKVAKRYSAVHARMVTV